MELKEFVFEMEFDISKSADNQICVNSEFTPAQLKLGDLKLILVLDTFIRFTYRSLIQGIVLSKGANYEKGIETTPAGKVTISTQFDTETFETSFMEVDYLESLCDQKKRIVGAAIIRFLENTNAMLKRKHDNTN